MWFSQVCEAYKWLPLQVAVSGFPNKCAESGFKTTSSPANQASKPPEILHWFYTGCTIGDFFGGNKNTLVYFQCKKIQKNTLVYCFTLVYFFEQKNTLVYFYTRVFFEQTKNTSVFCLH